MARRACCAAPQPRRTAGSHAGRRTSAGVAAELSAAAPAPAPGPNGPNTPFGPGTFWDENGGGSAPAAAPSSPEVPSTAPTAPNTAQRALIQLNGTESVRLRDLSERCVILCSALQRTESDACPLPLSPTDHAQRRSDPRPDHFQHEARLEARRRRQHAMSIG